MWRNILTALFFAGAICTAGIAAAGQLDHAGAVIRQTLGWW